MIGWLQFSKKLRQRKINWHRNIGKLYVLSVLISGTFGLYIALHATGGMIAKIGFFSLDIIWLYTTIMGFLTVKKGDIDQHKRMMIFSYAACFGAVTLRIWLPILTGLMGGFIPAYQVVAWLAWMPNILVAFIINRNIKSQQLTTT